MIDDPRFPRSATSTHPATRVLAPCLLALALAAGGACGPDAGDESAPPPPPEASIGIEQPLPEVTAAVERAAQTIGDELLVEIIEELSDDAMEGRGPGTPGDAKARAAIARRFEQAGLEPGAAGGGWEQSFDIVSVTSEAPDAWTFQTPEGPLSFAFWDEYIASSGVQSERAAIEDAEVVFVGYGIRAPEYEWDDFGDADLEGKVLLMLNNDPDWSEDLFAGERRLYYGRWTYKYEIAAEVGAAAAIIIHTTPSAGYPFQVVQSSWTGPQYELPAGDEPRLEISAWLTHDAAERLVAAAGHDLGELEQAARDRGFTPRPLGVRTSLALDVELERVETANVVGLAPGGELADQVVVFTAHHDHLGIGSPNADGDRIYNGARDNASGVAQIVAIARAWTSLPEPPRRSALFLAVGAEEQGLLGSKKYAEEPTFAPGKIAANLNFDSANVFGPTEDLPLVGFGKSDLDRVAVAAAERQGREVIGEIDPTLGSFYRSDQFNFAKIGVPALYFGQGTRFRAGADGEPVADAAAVEAWTETHYHQPSDEYDPEWNLDGAVEDARLGFIAGWMIAERDTLPSWNPGDEFEAARRAALAEVDATED